jgi:hypothetical protein
MIINYKLKKISIQKKNKIKGPVEAKNNLKITNITEDSLPSLSKEKALNIEFLFSVDYQPDIAALEIIGSITYMQDKKNMKEILENWKKNQKIKKEIAAPIFNYILSQCSIKALSLEEDLELPFHIPLPILKTKADTQPPKKAS